MKKFKNITAVITAALMTVGLAACQPEFEVTEPGFTTTEAPTETSPAPVEEEVLEPSESPEDADAGNDDVLTVEGFDVRVVEVFQDSRAGKYEREAQFGGWKDLDGDCIDTRNELLIQGMTTHVMNDKCQVASGVLVDPYSGKTVDFTRGRGTSNDVQIDHIMPVAYAWYAGAWAWSDEERIAFYNDTENLIAVSGDFNCWKSDLTPSEMEASIRQNGGVKYCSVAFEKGSDIPFVGQCAVATGWLNVAQKYDLPIWSADYDTLNNWLATC